MNHQKEHHNRRADPENIPINFGTKMQQITLLHLFYEFDVI